MFEQGDSPVTDENTIACFGMTVVQTLYYCKNSYDWNKENIENKTLFIERLLRDLMTFRIHGSVTALLNTGKLFNTSARTSGQILRLHRTNRYFYDEILLNLQRFKSLSQINKYLTGITGCESKMRVTRGRDQYFYFFPKQRALVRVKDFQLPKFKNIEYCMEIVSNKSTLKNLSSGPSDLIMAKVCLEGAVPYTPSQCATVFPTEFTVANSSIKNILLTMGHHVIEKPTIVV
jgi:hypothetical protein